jgi:hypothetical protein
MNTHRRCLFVGLLLALAVPRRSLAQPPAANAAFNAFIGALESRLTQQRRVPQTFVAGTVSPAGVPAIERLAGANLPGAQLHHWRGTAFVPGAKAADFERLLRDFKAYPQHFAPQVLDARVTSQEGDHLQAWMRVRQKHVLTVVLDATYDVSFGRLDPRDGYSASRSTRIYEVDANGVPAEDHGFLWRLNTYWTYEERDGGLYLQIESVSLSRAIPTGLGWAIRPYVDSVPRESLEFTLQSACKALKENQR